MELLGPGTVEKRSKAKWRLCASIKDNKGHTERLSKSVDARNKTEAKLLLDQWKRELIDADADCKSHKMTVGEYLDDYLEYCKESKSLSRTTMRGYSDIVKNRLDPELGDYLMTELTPYQLEEFFKKQLNTSGQDGGTLTASTRRK